MNFETHNSNESALHRMLASGKKVTMGRVAVLEYFLERPSAWLCAREMASDLVTDKPYLSPGGIFKSLAYLEKEGLVERVRRLKGPSLYGVGDNLPRSPDGAVPQLN